MTILNRLWISAAVLCCVTACASSPHKTRVAGIPAASTTPGKATTAKKAATVHMIEAPVVQPASALKLPPLHRFTLKNGLNVLFMRDAQIPLVGIKLLLKTGSIDDPAEQVGLADFTFMMLRQGVRGRTAEAISNEVDGAGAHLSASAGYEFSSISCGGRTTYEQLKRGKTTQGHTLALCADLVSRLTLAPLFPKKEMGEVRDNLLGAIKSYRDSPTRLASLHFYNMLYGDDHPAGRPLTQKGVQGIRRADLRRFHRQHVVPRGSLLVISGDLDLAQAKKVAARFSRWRGKKQKPRNITPVVDPAPGLRVLLIDKPTLSQSSFVLGHAGIHRRHPQKDALRITNWVLGGGGFSSRLMRSVRSQGGKTYGISSGFGKNEVDGSFEIRSTTRNKELVSTLRLVLNEMAKMGTKPPTASEIKAAKGNIAGGYAIRFKTGWQLASALASAQIRGFDDKYVTDFPLRIQGLTADEIAAAGQQNLHPRKLALSIVGKADTVGPLLKAAGIQFQRISFMDAISARDRAKAAVHVKIKPAEQRAARALVAQAVVAMGGKQKLAKLRAMKLTGKMTRGPIVARFETLLLPPKHIRMTMELALPQTKGMKMKVVQVLSGKTAFMINRGKKVTLPPHMIETLKAALWRQPAFLLRNALSRGVGLRVSKEKTKGKWAIEVYPQDGHPLTLLFDKKSMLLVGMKRRTRDGSESLSRLSEHRRVAGLWLPYRLGTAGGRASQRIDVEEIVINPKISAADITAP